MTPFPVISKTGSLPGFLCSFLHQPIRPVQRQQLRKLHPPPHELPVGCAALFALRPELIHAVLHVLVLRRSTQESGSLHERILGEDALELIMTAATDPAPELDAVPIERLRGVPMCLLRSDDLWGYNDYLMKECRRSGFEPNVPCQCYDTPMAMQLVRSGFGISFLPHSIVETHPISGIYAKPLRGIPAKSYPVLVWSDDVQGAPCVQRFIAES